MLNLLNHIDGQWLPSASGETIEQLNPADLAQVTCRFQRSTRDDVRCAIRAAERAFTSWSGLTMARRAAVLGDGVVCMRSRRAEIARTIVAENGKTMREALGEIDAAAQEMAWQIQEGLRLPGEIVPSAHAGVLAYTVRRPLGVVSVISPWNFPFNVPARKCTPALICGNTVVFKPASLTPGSGAWFVRVLEEAGLPPGVLNLVTGDGATVGDELVRNPAIRAISFTGSTPVGMGIHRAAAEGLIKTQMEMGGKNALVVLADADLDAAAEATVLGAFACAGQWCTSTSRAIVAEPVREDFTRRVLARVAQLQIGHGDREATSMGPVCGRSQMEGILQAIARATREGARLVCGGQRLRAGGLEAGCFIAPTVFTDVDPQMSVARDEIFGPVLAILGAAGLDEALALANDSDFGLSSSLYTASLASALHFVERSQVGLTHVNLPTSLKEPQLPFGGIKHSGIGTPEAGHGGIDFFTRHQAVYMRHAVP